jgi:putative transposase
MIAAVRSGKSQRGVARSFHVALRTVQRWQARAEGHSLDRVDWSDRSRAPHRMPRHTSPEIEAAVLTCRRQLKEESPLGFYGADAIHVAMRGNELSGAIPSVRTIGRILARNGALDHRGRIRHAAPPPCWYLADAARGCAELESFDVIEGLAIEGRGDVEVLTGRALWGCETLAWANQKLDAKSILARLLEHWRAKGLPDYAQFDNDNRFAGPQQYPDAVGRVARVCLSLGITPVYVPPRETGFQAAIESFNNIWQQKVWNRWHYDELVTVRSRSDRFVDAYESHLSRRNERAPQRRLFPPDWQLNLQADLAGRIIYLRRTDDKGIVRLLGRKFQIDADWPHRLVRCEFRVAEGTILCYRLRRRDPDQQPLLRVIKHRLPKRRFDE